MRFSLRRYDAADWPALLALWIESWTHTRPEIDFSERAPWLADLFARTADEGGQIVVAEDRRGLLGFVLFSSERQWLEQIAVSPRALGSGAAQALVGHAKQACTDGFGLDVNADNSRALAFYRCEGFVKIGSAKNPLSGLPVVALRWTPD
jgi:ribosomal protein S18 acetylase RimI-like enzyme